ncbi:MAG: phage major tail tube protein [Synergistaceae bacterium]|nr:phage major tail tube protein [Synergistaceae bacterium]
MANIINEKGINFAVYYAGEDQLGIAEGEFPSLEAMTSEVKGAGIAGVADTVVLGHFNSMTVTLKWRNTTDALVKLAAHKAHELDLYSAQQDYDAGSGEYRERSVHVFLRAIPKNTTMGNLVVGDSLDAETELEVLYLKLTVDGKERIELDKFNYIYKVDGVDYLAGVRSALGKQ